MPQFPEEYVTNGWVTGTVLGTDKLLVNNNAVAASDLAAYIAPIAAAIPQTTQTVPASPATATARFIVLDDDTHTSGAPGSLVMPPITAGAWHVVCTPYENVHFEITKAPGDPVNTGPDYTVDSSVMRQQMIFIFAAVSEGVLRWQYDSTGTYINTIFDALTILGNAGIGAQVISASSDTITGALDVYLTSSAVVVAVLLPDAAAGRRIRLHKSNNATTQTVQLVRSAGDYASGTINGVAADLDIVMTGITGPRRSFDVCASAALTWHVDTGETVAIAANTSSIATITGTTIPALATRVAALEVPSALACDGAGAVHMKSWTTEAEADVTDAVAAYTIGLDGNTTQWPVGVSRPVNKLNTSAFGITLDPQPTHTINGVAAGTNVLLMSSAAVPSGTVAAGIWRVKRLSATAWWVQ